MRLKTDFLCEGRDALHSIVSLLDHVTIAATLVCDTLISFYLRLAKQISRPGRLCILSRLLRSRRAIKIRKLGAQLKPSRLLSQILDLFHGELMVANDCQSLCTHILLVCQQIAWLHSSHMLSSGAHAQRPAMVMCAGCTAQ